jgi:hypothetical protein
LPKNRPKLRDVDSAAIISLIEGSGYESYGGAVPDSSSPNDHTWTALFGDYFLDSIWFYPLDLVKEAPIPGIFILPGATWQFGRQTIG